MKYDRIEKAKEAKASRDVELGELARLYAKSDSIQEFRLKANVVGGGKSRFMKWFRLFYFVKNRGIYGAFPWLVVVPPGVLAMTVIGFCVESMAHCSKSGGWQLLCALVFIMGGLACSSLLFMAFRRIAGSLELVKDAVWREE